MTGAKDDPVTDRTMIFACAAARRAIDDLAGHYGLNLAVAAFLHTALAALAEKHGPAVAALAGQIAVNHFSQEAPQ